MHKKTKIVLKILKGIGIFLLSIIGLVLLGLLFIKLSSNIKEPDIQEINPDDYKRVIVDTNHYQLNGNWLNKNKFGLWELYLEGSPYERGIIAGELTQELIYKQEAAFVDQIKKMIPSDSYIKFLKNFIAFFNRNIDENIPQEYLQEIYGVSKYASQEFSFIGPNYYRILNYHAAHDIGHALQNMNLVACTSFAVWDDYTSDSSLLIGRNFDFYVGDKFAEDKIVMFCKPDSGFRFMMVTWGGMFGAVSGMNEKGLTVTLNAAKSEIPFSAATPISLVAREILQYAGNIDEAQAIASKSKTFVSESLLIGSALDKKAAIIEKSPEQQSLFSTKGSNIISTNHFQSDQLKKDEIVNSPISDYATLYRYKIVKNLISEKIPIDIPDMAVILRNRKGLNGADIGMGNEKAINQLIAHHSIIFQPDLLKVWVSASPYQLGEYVCYDLNKIFSMKEEGEVKIYTVTENIPPDPFLNSTDYENFKKYKKQSVAIQNKAEKFSASYFRTFISLNPKFYQTYEIIGDYYRDSGNNKKALEYYNMALTKEVPNYYQVDNIQEKLKKIKIDH